MPQSLPWSRPARRFLPAVTGFLFLAASAGGTDSPRQKVHQTERIRVFYYTDGPHAADGTDANANGIPDQVEDLLTQTRAAKMLWVDVLGFLDPFASERFRSARFLDIHLRNKERLKTNGVAFDELQFYKRPGDPPNTASLCFNVASSVKPSANPTPAHEYFHLIQYATTYFKNRWFTEGLARWSEDGLGSRRSKGSAVPAAAAFAISEELKAAVPAMAYEASGKFWEPLARITDPDSTIPDSASLAELSALKYVNGAPVLKDRRLEGWRFVRRVLAQLGAIDDRTFSEQGYDRWSEANQLSPANNEYIFRAIDAAARP